jgi:curved DNA-binding protein
MNEEKETYYNILEVNRNATIDEIKKAYRTLALKYHPDRNNGNDICKQRFQKISEAHEILSNEAKKHEYDNRISPKINLEKQMQDVFEGFFANSKFQSSLSNMQRVFHQFIKPPPLKINLSITFEQSYNGTMLPIEYQKEIEKNSGEIVFEQTKTYVSIMRGIDNGEVVELKEKGNEIQRDGITYRGDLFVTIIVEPNPKFTRKGLDLYYLQHITLKEALIGCEISIPLFDEKTIIINTKKKEPTANQTVIKPTKQMTIPKRGMFRENMIGSLIISFCIEFPDTLTNEQIEKINETL